MEMDQKQLEALVSEVMNKMAEQGTASAVSYKPDASFGSGFEALGAGGNEPFDIDYGMMDTGGNIAGTPYPRIEKMIKRVLGTKGYVDAERAMLATEAYKMFDGDNIPIKEAKVLAYILKNITIRIHDDELLVGEIAAPSCGAPIFPDFSFDWIIEEMNAGVWNNRNNDIFYVTDEDKAKLNSIADFWKGKGNADKCIGLLTDEEKKGSTLGPHPIHFPNLPLYGGIGHMVPRYQKILSVGYIGLKKEIVECMGKLDLAKAEDVEKREFYISSLITLEAVKDYYLRWGKLCRDTAAETADAKRKAELVKMAENLEWISENPPRDFYEAMQLYYMIGCICYIEMYGQGISWGRFDQLLYPFYEKDMKEGKISKMFVGELIETLYVKFHEMRRLRDDETARLNSEIGIGGTMILLGGCDENGVDITNDLSFLGLEAHAHTQLPDPWISCRWSLNAPWEFKVKVVNTIKVGTSQPKVYNDECMIPNMMRAGRTLEEARNYSMVGCAEVDSGGLEYGWHDSSYMNIAKVFELAINNGRCIDCSKECPRYAKCAGAGVGLGPDTGSLKTFKSIEEVKNAYIAQMDYWVKSMNVFLNAVEITHARNKPTPYSSLLIENCIQKGKDLAKGGAIYNFTGTQGIGVGTVGDSLCTIKQLVFEEKKISGAELLDAISKNWEGCDALWALVNSDHVHHFGNDDDYADELAAFAARVYTDAVSKCKNMRGGVYTPGLWSVSANVGIGMTQGATPDGRKAYTALSNCMGPVQTDAGCHDVNGPTAMARSSAKCDHIAATNGTLLNVRFTPSCVSGVTGRDNFIQYIDDYFSKKGFHMQFNIVNTATLKDAQIHPEKYPTLLVRVAGYSAYFTKLSKELQDDLIGRNSYDSFD